MSRREQSRNFVKDVRYIHWRVVPSGDALSTGDGKDTFHVNKEIVGYRLVGVDASVDDPSSSSGISLQLYSANDSADLLSTPITIDSGDYTSTSASTPSVVTAGTVLKSGDRLRADVDNDGNGASGLVYHLTIRNF